MDFKAINIMAINIQAINILAVSSLEKADAFVWGPWLLCMLLGTGIYLTVRLKGKIFKNLKTAFRLAFGGQGISSEKKRGQVSSFSSFMTELAVTLGTGNIVGVVTAMVLGGPGALFWMVATSLIGMATRLVESALSVKYRSRNDLGETVGGPMYTCVRGLKKGQFGKILGISFAVFTVMASFGMGNMVQANAVADSFHAAFGIDKACVGVVISVLTIFCVLGGIESIGKLTRLLVPFMGILYLAGTICVILVHWKNVPETLAGIVLAAFCPRAVSGGLFGSVTVSFFSALRWGVSRGIFSNEAGLGAAGITAAAADTEDYVRQGYISMTGVFLDTVVMCSLTGLAFASSGVLSDASQQESAAADGAVLVLKMFRSTFGVKADGFVSVCIALFAFATIAGWAYQGEKAFEFLAKGRTKYNISYRFVYSLMSFLGCILSLDTVWLISDICNGLMAVPNLICVLLMSGEICRDIHRWKPDTPL